MPNPQAGGPFIVGCPRLLIQYIRSYPPYWRPFLHPQPKDASCRGDRDPLIMVHKYYKVHAKSGHEGLILNLNLNLIMFFFNQSYIYTFLCLFCGTQKKKKLKNKLTLEFYCTKQSVSPLYHQQIFKENNPGQGSTWQLCGVW